MRYIDLKEIRKFLPPDWETRANTSLAIVRAAGPEERHSEINKRSSLWTELKSALSELSNGKCWYCKSKEDRSDKSVDHFRPKNAVAENPAHEGYWWLAFQWQNYNSAAPIAIPEDAIKKQELLGVSTTTSLCSIVEIAYSRKVRVTQNGPRCLIRLWPLTL